MQTYPPRTVEAAKVGSSASRPSLVARPPPSSFLRMRPLSLMLPPLHSPPPPPPPSSPLPPLPPFSPRREAPDLEAIRREPGDRPPTQGPGGHRIRRSLRNGLGPGTVHIFPSASTTFFAGRLNGEEKW